MITTGSLQAINILTKTFIDPGDTIVVENPCFIGAISAFKSYEAEIISVPLKANGIDLDQLRAAVNDEKQKTQICLSNAQFSQSRRNALLC